MIYQMWSNRLYYYTAFSFTNEAVCSKSGFVAESAFRMRSFKSHICGRRTAAVKFLRPPYGHHRMRSFHSYFCSRRTAAVKFLRPPQLLCLRKFESLRTAAAANVRATVWGRMISTADAGFSKFTFCGGRTAAITNVRWILILGIFYEKYIKSSFRQS